MLSSIISAFFRKICVCVCVVKKWLRGGVFRYMFFLRQRRKRENTRMCLEILQRHIKTLCEISDYVQAGIKSRILNILHKVQQIKNQNRSNHVCRGWVSGRLAPFPTILMLMNKYIRFVLGQHKITRNACFLALVGASKHARTYSVIDSILRKIEDSHTHRWHDTWYNRVIYKL